MPSAEETLMGKRLMPTNLNSAQLEQMGREFTQRAVFSAGCNHLQTVQAIRDGSRKILNGEWLNASAREFLQAVLKFYNYEAPACRVMACKSSGVTILARATDISRFTCRLIMPGLLP